jgi:hypothetical protein
MKKWSKRLSSWLIAVATIGFAWTTYYDWRVKELEKTAEDSQLAWDERYRESRNAQNHYYLHWQATNHHQILHVLRAPPQLIEEASRAMEDQLKNAIIAVATSTKRNPAVEEEIKKLHSYSELWPVFLREQLKAVDEINKLKQTIIFSKKTISSMEGFRNGCYIFFLVLNSVGFLLGLLIQSPDEDRRSRTERRRLG